MKRGSEDRVREALSDMDLDTWIYKPPDDARNWKPADYIVWVNPPDPPELKSGTQDRLLLAIAKTSFVEVKDVDAVRLFNLKELRPAQKNAILRSAVMGIPYWVVVWWRRHGKWTISPGIRLVEAGRSLTFVEMTSSHGIEAEPHLLASTLRMVLVDEAF